MTAVRRKQLRQLRDIRRNSPRRRSLKSMI
jgi:hypothetical protein